MSSGQRRQALLDFVLVMISNLNEEDRKKIILAIDEPELSVDASSRIQQFEKLDKTTKLGSHIVFTTHWYGWITQLIDGNAILINESESGREIGADSIEKFLEKDIQKKAPYEMRMMFDFLSSLGSWAESNPENKFVICEGITDDLLIKKHFPSYKSIPTRGIDEVIRLHKIFADYYFNVKSKPKNVVFLIDTDLIKSSDAENCTGENLKRISRDSNGFVKIVNNKENFSDQCSIDDLLSPDPFLAALKKSIYLLSNQTDKDFINNLKVVYQNETGIRAFSLDDVKKVKFRKIYKGEFKMKVSEFYDPSPYEIENFKNLLKLF